MAILYGLLSIVVLFSSLHIKMRQAGLAISWPTPECQQNGPGSTLTLNQYLLPYSGFRVYDIIIFYLEGRSVSLSVK